jgi:S-formylglutathione hydrolase FrmB
VSGFPTLEVSDAGLAPPGFTFCTVRSPALGRRADVLFYNAACDCADIPVIILLHGVYGSAWSWAFQGGAHQVYDRLRSAGKIGDFALVMPSDGLAGDGSGYVDRMAGRFDDWIAHEVVELARLRIAHMSAASPVFIAGLSMGGFGALRLARLHPGTFAAVSAHSPICEAADFRHFTNDDPLSDTLDPAVPTAIADLYAARGIPVPPIRFDCGDEDVLRPSVERLASRLKLAGVPHRYEPLSGGHDWAYWSTAFERTLAFFDTIGRSVPRKE